MHMHKHMTNSACARACNILFQHVSLLRRLELTYSLFTYLLLLLTATYYSLFTYVPAKLGEHKGYVSRQLGKHRREDQQDFSPNALCEFNGW